MSRRKRGRAHTPPQVPPAKDAVHSAIDQALRLQHGGAELSSLRLEIGVGSSRAGEPEEQVPLPLPESTVEQYAQPLPPEADVEQYAQALPNEPEAPRAAIEPAESHPEPASAEMRFETEHRMEEIPSPRGLGRRFSEARAAQGLSLVDAARRLRFPLPVLADIEAERFEALGAPIYARSYLKSYARLVQLPEAALGPVFASFDQVEPTPQPVVSVRQRPLAPRFATPALYALLTLLLVVPVAVQLYQRSKAPSAPQVSAPERTGAREIALDGPARTDSTTSTAAAPAGNASPESRVDESSEMASSSHAPGGQPAVSR